MLDYRNWHSLVMAGLRWTFYGKNEWFRQSELGIIQRRVGGYLNVKIPVLCKRIESLYGKTHFFKSWFIRQGTRWLYIINSPHALDQFPNLEKATETEGGRRERTVLAARGKMAESSSRRWWDQNLGIPRIYRPASEPRSKDTCRPKNGT